MAEVWENQERAKALFDEGFFKKDEKGFIGTLLAIGEDRVGSARDYYNEKCTGGTQSKITRDEAEKMLQEYDENKAKWLQESDEENSAIGSIFDFIFLILLIAIWLGIRYVKVLMASYKQAKIVDAIELRYVAPELEEKCEFYREALKNLKTCPRRIKTLSATNPYMSLAGVAYVLLALYYFTYNYIGSWNKYISTFSVNAPFIIFFSMQLLLGLELIARRKFSAGILFGLQTMFGLFVTNYHVLTGLIHSNWRFEFAEPGLSYMFNQATINPAVLYISVVILFILLCMVMTIYFMSNAKSKVVEIILYVGFVGGILLANDRYYSKLGFVFSKGNLLVDRGERGLPMMIMQFAWLVIVLFMFMGKRKLK